MYEYWWGRTTVVYDRIRDKESEREGTRLALETSATRMNLPSRLRVFLRHDAGRVTPRLCVVPILSSSFLRARIWLTQIKAINPLAISKNQIRWYRYGAWKTFFMSSELEWLWNGWNGKEGIAEVDGHSKGCLPQLSSVLGASLHIIAFRLHYQIISQLKKPGY